MDNAYTISAHFGKKMSRDHNIRNRNIACLFIILEIVDLHKGSPKRDIT